VPRTLGVLLGVFYFRLNLKFKNMMLVSGILCLAVALLMYAVKELYGRLGEMEKILKSMNDDLNMVSKTMDNMYRDQQGAKQILKG
jgi:hypothetical protein